MLPPDEAWQHIPDLLTFTTAAHAPVGPKKSAGQKLSHKIHKGETMRSRLLIVVFAMALALSCAFAAHAEIHKVIFDVFTHYDPNSGTPNTLRFNIEVADTNGLSGPNAIDWNIPPTITIPTAAAPTVITVTINDWEEWAGFFQAVVNPANLVPVGKIPSGTYTLSLTDIAGRTFTSTNTLAAAVSTTPYLGAPVVSTPVAAYPFILQWTKVKGAAFYQIKLRDLDWREPVYWFPKWKLIYAPTTPTSTKVTYTFPPGVIRTGHHYSVQIEVRDNDKDMSKRSRSLWKEFVGP
ncbi:MAG: hypothetical protein WAW37_13330 [Syntrophobacteraceae bacterium]